ncbi:MAG: hypothetical protein J0H00_08825 [Burkholderiales bacterium]|nr:hypothetical protein [Burkholderiales bacterium]
MISFTGTSRVESGVGLSDSQTLAVGWSQSSSSSNVTLSAAIRTDDLLTTGNWYVTTAIGPTATEADVVFSGSYSPVPRSSWGVTVDTVQRTLLGSGLHFDPGTYYLVLVGPPNWNWWAMGRPDPTITLAPGFTIGNYYVASVPWAITLNPFAPENSGARYIFEMESVDRAVPLPSTLPMAATGLLALSLARRRSVPALQH